ncbi:hypothetical protein FHR99_001436 [Litorivivens lipolytica]|uniref:Transporter n=1 Tax=Litorivivens lipolytica TaxID=1524264 RepID=A0A7W4W498_9GAMM|nr:AEC family transporter [Litorivivens lipolytica]MBB3047200.1 hypothetical protein [Litorivivens lipolytica]
MASLLFLSFSSIFPVFGWIFLGAAGIRLVPSTHHLFHLGEKFVFYVGIPGILFITASRIDPGNALTSTYSLAGIAATISSLLLCWAVARWRGFNREQTGIITQAGYRANLGIIGLALCASTFGEEGLLLAALPVAVWTLTFNILAVMVLNAAYGGKFSLLPLLRNLVRNPLIVGISFGFVVALSPFELPDWFYRSGEFFTAAVIPLSLIFLGGAIDLKPSLQSRQALLLATALRLIVAPALALGICLLLGLRDTELGVNFLLLSGPVAAASHIMVAARGGDAKLAANIVVLSTVLAPITITFGLFMLRFLSLV